MNFSRKWTILVFLLLSSLFVFAVAEYAANDPIASEKAKGSLKVKHDKVPEATELYSLRE